MVDNTYVAFVSLGCAKNTVDSEKMLGQLAEAGCVLTSSERDADVVVVNTCGFLAAARDEAHQVIRDLVKVKKKKNTRLKRIVVVGCLVQRDGESLLEAIPEIDIIVGVHNRDDVVRAVIDKKSPRAGFLDDYHPLINIDKARLRITPEHWAYLRIGEGCNQKCTFCTIPAIRGPLHSKPRELVLSEARELISDGAVELCLIGQDTTSYGLDWGEKSELAPLLRDLNKLDGVKWLRLMYVYPSVMTDEIIDAIAECEKVVKYIDIPLQHINDRMLKRMHRQFDRNSTIDLLTRIRNRIPNVTLRTTLISGFPGETEAEHQELADFLREFRFNALGVFGYSPEPDTPAGRMADQIPEEEKLRRVEELMLIQQEIAFAQADEMKGKRVKVLVDTPPREGLQESRHAGQAPEVDSITWLQGTNYEPGSLVEVECVGRSDYDLYCIDINSVT